MDRCMPLCASGSEEASSTCDALVLGLEGSGKSLLCRRLQNLYAKDGNSSAAHFSAYTVTTNGIQLNQVACPPLGSKIPFRSIMLREIGGTMSPLWPQYYDDCRMVVFVIDASDAASIAPSAVELCELMQHPKLAGKPVCVVLSKQDQALVLSRQEIELVMHLSDLERVAGHSGFRVLELSAISGAPRPDGDMVLDAPEGLLDWLVDSKCAALGINAPNRSAVQASGGLFTSRDIVQQANSLA